MANSTEPPPSSLTDSAEYAENIYDAAYTSQWKQAEAKAADLKTSSGAYPSLVASLPDLETKIRQQDRLGTMSVSNEMTRQAAELMRRYSVPTPVEVSLLDYEGRKIQTDAAANDEAALKRTAHEIRRRWDSVRPEVERHGGGSEAKAFESEVKKLEIASSVTESEKVAKSILDQVDRLENVFTRNPR
ncbi:MAG: hypothetical protein WBX15_18530 [Thermoanaerobaculia bacterium]